MHFAMGSRSDSVSPTLGIGHFCELQGREVKKTYVKPTVRSRAFDMAILKPVRASLRSDRCRATFLQFARRSENKDPEPNSPQEPPTSVSTAAICNHLINFLPTRLSGSGSNKVSKSSRFGAVCLTFKKGSEQG